MTDLPSGWEWAKVGEVGRVQLGRQRSPKFHTGDNMKPYLRVANVFEDRIDASDVKSMHFEPDEFERFRLYPGDILLNEGQSPEFLGRPAMYKGHPENIAFTNSLIRFQAHDGIEPAWALLVFRRHMHFGRFARESRITTNIAHLSATRFSEVEFPVPPLAEQRRIVAVLDEQLSRLGSAVSSLAHARTGLAQYSLSARTAGLASVDAKTGALRDVVADIHAGKSFTCEPRPARTDEWGVIKVSAMTWGEFRENENKAVPATRAIDPRFEIKSGDMLVSRANTPEYVGAPVLVRDTRPKLLLSDKSLRIVLRPGVDQEWLLQVLLSRAVRRQITALSTGTKESMRNISQENLLSVRIDIPDRERQRDMAGLIIEDLALASRLGDSVEQTARRTTQLRKGLLDAAFAGLLVDQDPADGSASELLTKIRAERMAVRPTNRRSRSTKTQENSAVLVSGQSPQISLKTVPVGVAEPLPGMDEVAV